MGALVVHPIPWTIVDPQFAYAGPNRLRITGIPNGKSVDSCRNPSSGLPVDEAQKPSVKAFRAANLVHTPMYPKGNSL